MTNSGKPQNLYQQIIEEIQCRIRKGELAPGDALPSERELAEQFNVSRVPVREAIKIMEFIGMIEVDSASRKKLRTIDITQLFSKFFCHIEDNFKTLFDLFDTRIIIEPEATKMAALNRKKEDILQLKTTVERMKLSQNNPHELYEASMQTHLAIIHATDNKLLQSMYQGLYDYLIFSKSISMEESSIQKSIEEHEQIADSIINRDGERAKQLMLRHLTEAKERFINRYTRMNDPS